jgi:hypothetical protein
VVISGVGNEQGMKGLTELLGQLKCILIKMNAPAAALDQLDGGGAST